MAQYAKNSKTASDVIIFYHGNLVTSKALHNLSLVRFEHAITLQLYVLFLPYFDSSAYKPQARVSYLYSMFWTFMMTCTIYTAGKLDTCMCTVHGSDLRGWSVSGEEWWSVVECNGVVHVWNDDNLEISISLYAWPPLN